MSGGVVGRRPRSSLYLVLDFWIFWVQLWSGHAYLLYRVRGSIPNGADPMSSIVEQKDPRFWWVEGLMIYGSLRRWPPTS